MTSPTSAASREISTLLFPFRGEIDLGEARARKKRNRPVESDPQSCIPSRHLEQIVGAPHPPCDEPGELEASHLGGGTRVAKRCHGSQRFENERSGIPPVDRSDHVFRNRPRRANSMLSQRGIDATAWRRRRSAISKCPHVLVAHAAQSCVGDDATFSIPLYSDRGRNSAWQDSRSEHDRVSLESSVLPQYPLGLDCRYRRGCAELRTPRAEYSRGILGEKRFCLGDQARARLEQTESEIVGLEVSIVSQLVPHERRYFTEQLHSNESAANHDYCEQLPAFLRIWFDIRAFQALDEMIPEKKPVCHRLESSRVLRSRDHRHVRVGPKRDDYMIERQIARFAFCNANLYALPLEIDGLDGSFDEVHTPQAWPDRLRAMAKLENTRARFEQERAEQKEIVAADERYFDVVPPANQSIEVPGSSQAAHAATQDDDLLSGLIHFLIVPATQTPFDESRAAL